MNRTTFGGVEIDSRSRMRNTPKEGLVCVRRRTYGVNLGRAPLLTGRLRRAGVGFQTHAVGNPFRPFYVSGPISQAIGPCDVSDLRPKI